MTTANLLQRWYEEVWNLGNESHIDEMMHKDVIIHGLDATGTTIGVSNFHQFYKSFRESFPVVNVSLLSLVHDETTATAFCSITAKSKTSREVTFTGLCVVRYKDGKMIEGWNSFDFLKMYQQLGHILVEPIADKV